MFELDLERHAARDLATEDLQPIFFGRLRRI